MVAKVPGRDQGQRTRTDVVTCPGQTAVAGPGLLEETENTAVVAGPGLLEETETGDTVDEAGPGQLRSIVIVADPGQRLQIDDEAGQSQPRRTVIGADPGQGLQIGVEAGQDRSRSVVIGADLGQSLQIDDEVEAGPGHETTAVIGVGLGHLVEADGTGAGPKAGRPHEVGERRLPSTCNIAGSQADLRGQAQ